MFKKYVLFFLSIFYLSILWAQHYNFQNPNKTIHLPAELNEISDITLLNTKKLICIQDENGVLFRLDVFKNKPIEKDSFYFDGDYEGIARVKNDIYVLRSDGMLIKIQGVNTGKLITTTYSTNIVSTNNEGLCYDKKNNRLLIAAKSRSSKDKEAKDKRYIYAYNLLTNQLVNEPVLEINITEIQKLAAVKYSLTDSVAEKMRIRPSAIAIHPVSQKLYVLTATGCAICIYSSKVLEDVIMLDPLLFNKAEGICFTNKGDVIISNEAGSNSNATLLYFSCRKNN